ncbi:MAG: SHOCT domain-containing protein [Gammaproteobacteria bacterium]|nr:SHOCT domain-containing protein [Gammaproteobacteria bacterium]MDH3364235.1 SHOCT domain-containing protein [Gammaproteobacteria bacterium]
MSRTPEQLRSLGELKDAGYVTEDEFERIRQKILNSQL